MLFKIYELGLLCPTDESLSLLELYKGPDAVELLGRVVPGRW
jgi:hypothetical protein